jgi:NADP-dependent 3-hydroxy acid dehydrogenase YdfG
MTGFGQNLRMELQPYNIAVTNIYPGAVYTGSWEGVDIDKNAFVQVEDIAELVNTICHLSPMAVVEDLVIRPMRGDM